MTAPALPSAASTDAAALALPALERDDIQSLILHGHGHLPKASYIFLRAGQDAAKTRAWLAAVAARVSVATRAEDEKPTRAVHLAVTDAGLVALGVSDKIRMTFLQEFREGMGDADRARALGDVAGSAPEHWDCGGPSTPPIHFVLILYGANAARSELDAADLRQLGEAGLSVVLDQKTTLRPDLVEPFGFRDGIAQPALAGVEPVRARDGKTPGSAAPPQPSAEPPVPPGEFIFGYPNAYSAMPFGPRVPDDAPSAGLLPPVPGAPKWRDLGKNGTYLVIRKLEQDVAGFRGFLAANQDRAPGKTPAEREEWLAARLVGRWRNGAPLRRDSVAGPPQLAAGQEPPNDFDFSDDREGRACPIGAHIRRTNPRAAMPNTDDDRAGHAESLKLAMRHRLIRRGRPYTSSDGPKEGIMFVAINTNIARQFELIQQSWLNNPRFGGLQNSRNPLAGANLEPGGESDPRACTMALFVKDQALRLRLTGIERFIHTRGGGYFFLPGLRALKYLATAAFK